MYTPWVLLNFRDSRRFLLRHDFSASSYEIQVTDFASLWTEQLDRRRIVGRALDEDTVIDPSEDSSQLSLLLQYIRGMLEPGRKGARLEVHMQTQQKLHIEGINVLPKPLRDLKWPFRLSQTNKCTLATELIAPLISQGYVQNKRIEGLVQELEQKDAAINKLLEKLEGTGVELASVFPTLASHRGGRHIVTRSQVLQQVQGLKPFDAQAWQSMRNDDISLSQSFAAVLDGAMAGILGSATQRMVDLVVRKMATSMSGREEDLEGDTTLDQTVEPVAAAAMDSFISDGFQRQATPPHLAKPSEARADASPNFLKSPKELDLKTRGKEKPLASLSKELSYRGKEPEVSNAIVDDEETTDDEDLDAPYNSAPKPSLKSASPVSAEIAPGEAPGPAQRSTKLGSLKGLHIVQLEAVQDSEEPQRHISSPETHKEPISSPRISPPPQKPAIRTRLGRLGGSRRQDESASEQQPEEHQVEAETSLHSRHQDRSAQSGGQNEGPSKKDGGIDDGGASNSSPTASAPQSPLPQDREDHSMQVIKPQGVPEESGERADRKREELKRQLAEQQKQAGAGKLAKKRRRF